MGAPIDNPILINAAVLAAVVYFIKKWMNEREAKDRANDEKIEEKAKELARQCSEYRKEETRLYSVLKKAILKHKHIKTGVANEEVVQTEEIL